MLNSSHSYICIDSQKTSSKLLFILPNRHLGTAPILLYTSVGTGSGKILLREASYFFSAVPAVQGSNRGGEVGVYLKIWSLMNWLPKYLVLRKPSP